VDNYEQAYNYYLSNLWDDGYPSGGNYWSDHVCTGNPSDGSQPYLTGGGGIDHYPFQDPNGWIPKYILTIYSSPTGVTFTVDGMSYATPWSGTYSEGASVNLVMPETHNGYVWSHWLEDGDTSRIKTITLPRTTYTAVYTEPPVGGYSLPIKGYTAEKPLTLYLALIAILAASFTMIKRKTHKRTKRP